MAVCVGEAAYAKIIAAVAMAMMASVMDSAIIHVSCTACRTKGRDTLRLFLFHRVFASGRRSGATRNSIAPGINHRARRGHPSPILEQGMSRQEKTTL
jgi:hypothetical protein